jgi:hypothetical protein
MTDHVWPALTALYSLWAQHFALEKKFKGAKK